MDHHVQWTFLMINEAMLFWNNKLIGFQSNSGLYDRQQYWYDAGAGYLQLGMPRTFMFSLSHRLFQPALMLNSQKIESVILIAKKIWGGIFIKKSTYHPF